MQITTQQRMPTKSESCPLRSVQHIALTVTRKEHHAEYSLPSGARRALPRAWSLRQGARNEIANVVGSSAAWETATTNSLRRIRRYTKYWGGEPHLRSICGRPSDHIFKVVLCVIVVVGCTTLLDWIGIDLLIGAQKLLLFILTTGSLTTSVQTNSSIPYCF